MGVFRAPAPPPHPREWPAAHAPTDFSPDAGGKIERKDDQNHDRQIAKAEGQRIFLPGGEGAWNESDTEGSAGQWLQVQHAKLDGDGHAKGGDGEIVGTKPNGQRTDRPGQEARDNGSTQPANTIGMPKPPKRSGLGGVVRSADV